MKTIVFLSSTRKDLRALPPPVRSAFGFALRTAQQGDRPRTTKTLTGFGNAQVVELVEDYQTDTYRAVYTVQFAEVVYVLHVFQKKSKRGSTLPEPDRDLIVARLQQAREHYQSTEE